MREVVGENGHITKVYSDDEMPPELARAIKARSIQVGEMLSNGETVESVMDWAINNPISTPHLANLNKFL